MFRSVNRQKAEPTRPLDFIIASFIDRSFRVAKIRSARRWLFISVQSSMYDEDGQSFRGETRNRLMDFRRAERYVVRRGETRREGRPPVFARTADGPQTALRRTVRISYRTYRETGKAFFWAEVAHTKRKRPRPLESTSRSVLAESRGIKITLNFDKI